MDTAIDLHALTDADLARLMGEFGSVNNSADSRYDFGRKINAEWRRRNEIDVKAREERKRRG